MHIIVIVLIIPLCFFFSRYFYTEIDCTLKKYRELSHETGSSVLPNDDMINAIFQLRSDQSDRGKIELRPGWQLHLYVSQLPCAYYRIMCFFLIFLLS